MQDIDIGIYPINCPRSIFLEKQMKTVLVGRTIKMKQIEANPEVAVCAVDWFSGHGTGKNLGWVLEPQNTELRSKLREAFSWYNHANDEQDKNCCFLEIRLTDGMLIKDHHTVRYQIDFVNKTALLSENWGEFK